ncbi:hypothetical protein [Paenibacillus odorifer]|uniref:hypothetical protein n=1 Tax=Paenibacillus odorifer TaxID=189426 RepID=UPI00096D1D0D|nr:hypothetical protein [Paenibacillus odorifer]OMD67625.1 hypothetical protein BSK50_30105 [Paenibacillus odorifer]
MKPENLINKQINIIDPDSQYYGHWGYIRIFDGYVFHVSGGSISSSFGEITPIFDREQFKIKRIT